MSDRRLLEDISIPTGRNGDRVVVPARTVVILAAAVLYGITWAVDRFSPAAPAPKVQVESLEVDTRNIVTALEHIHAAQTEITRQQTRALDQNAQELEEIRKLAETTRRIFDVYPREDWEENRRMLREMHQKVMREP